MKLPKSTKGQVFFKFLWNFEKYQLKGGVSPLLTRDLERFANQERGESSTKITTTMIFHWINGSVIPKWARVSAYKLCISLNWQPIDSVDLLTIIGLETSSPSIKDILSILDRERIENKINPPAILVKKLLMDIDSVDL